MYKYYFHIVDREFDDEYDFQGYFLDHDDIEPFIKDNEKVGNTVTIVAPYYELVPVTECPAIYANAIRQAVNNC